MGGKAVLCKSDGLFESFDRTDRHGGRSLGSMQKSLNLVTHPFNHRSLQHVSCLKDPHLRDVPLNGEAPETPNVRRLTGCRNKIFRHTSSLRSPPSIKAMSLRNFLPRHKD